MGHDNFMDEIQHRAQLSSRGEALAATRATFRTLGDRIDPGFAENLGTKLPRETAHYLEEVDDAERFDWQEFVDHVVEREDISSDDVHADAAFHAQVIIDVVEDVVTEG